MCEINMPFADMSSPWLAIGPALIAGGIGLIAALLSYRSAKNSLAYSAVGDRERRNYEYDLLILEKRLNAIETIWQAIFEMERSRRLSGTTRDEVIRAVVWLPEEAGRSALEVVADFDEQDPLKSGIERLREVLLSLTKTKEEARR